MKSSKILALLLCVVTLLSSCLFEGQEEDLEGYFYIKLDDTQITVNGESVSEDEENEVYVAKDIVYYESGKDFSYGEGTEKDVNLSEAAEAGFEIQDEDDVFGDFMVDDSEL